MAASDRVRERSVFFLATLGRHPAGSLAIARHRKHRGAPAQACYTPLRATRPASALLQVRAMPLARDPYLPRRDFGWLAILALVLLGLILGGLVGAVYFRPKPDARAGAVAAAAMDRASAAADQRRADAANSIPPKGGPLRRPRPRSKPSPNTSASDISSAPGTSLNRSSASRSLRRRCPQRRSSHSTGGSRRCIRRGRRALAP